MSSFCPPDLASTQSYVTNLPNLSFINPQTTNLKSETEKNTPFKLEEKKRNIPTISLTICQAVDTSYVQKGLVHLEQKSWLREFLGLKSTGLKVARFRNTDMLKLLHKPAS